MAGAAAGRPQAGGEQSRSGEALAACLALVGLLLGESGAGDAAETEEVEAAVRRSEATPEAAVRRREYWYGFRWANKLLAQRVTGGAVAAPPPGLLGGGGGGAPAGAGGRRRAVGRQAVAGPHAGPPIPPGGRRRRQPDEGGAGV